MHAVRFAETFMFCVVTEMVECGEIAGYRSPDWNMWTDSSAAHDAGDRAPVSARFHISSSKGGECFMLLRNGVTVDVLISASGATVYERAVYFVWILCKLTNNLRPCEWVSYYCSVIEVTCYGQDSWDVKQVEMLVNFWAVGSDNGILQLGLAVVDLSFVFVAKTSVLTVILVTF
jgi:hypothetical protein